MEDGSDAEAHYFHQMIFRANGPLEVQFVQQFVEDFRCDEAQYRRMGVIWNTVKEKNHSFLPAKNKGRM